MWTVYPSYKDLNFKGFQFSLVLCHYVYHLFYYLRCPGYKNLPSSCHMETDPSDPCCQTPVCGYDISTGKVFVPVPSFQPAVTGMGVVQPPTIQTGSSSNQHYTGYYILKQTGFTPAPPTIPAGAVTGSGK